MMGFFIVHPKARPPARIDRDFCHLAAGVAVEPGTSTPNPNIMTDFNLFTFNSRVWPGTAPLVVEEGRTRAHPPRQPEHGQPSHPHARPSFLGDRHRWRHRSRSRRRWPENTVNVPVGATRDIEFVADNPGDWPFHCHKSHHTMNAMSHDIPNMLGVDQSKGDAKSTSCCPATWPWARPAWAKWPKWTWARPKNTLPMMSGGQRPLRRRDGRHVHRAQGARGHPQLRRPAPLQTSAGERLPAQSVESLSASRCFLQSDHRRLQRQEAHAVCDFPFQAGSRDRREPLDPRVRIFDLPSP